MRLRCPVCYAESALEAWVGEAEARAFLGVLAQCPDALAPALVRYVGLWRAQSRAVGWGRATRIAQDALALEPDPAILTAALDETVETLRARRAAGEAAKPLTNHRYLAAVLETARSRAALPVPVVGGPPSAGPAPAAESRTLAAARALESLR